LRVWSLRLISKRIQFTASREAFIACFHSATRGAIRQNLLPSLLIE
jgi:hypothetical protein